MKICKQLVNTSFILLLVSLSACQSLVDELAFFPDKVNVIPANKLPSGIEEVSITTEDGVTIKALYLTSLESKRVLIYFHGNAGNIYQRIPSLIQLHKAGVNVLGVSYRGYGRSEGEPTEAGVYLDGESAYRYVMEKMGFSSNNIILFGRSIGTTVAINTAMNKQIEGLILVTPLTSAKEQAKAGGLAWISMLAGDALDNLSKIEHIKAPLLVIHGTHDNVIPYSMGRTIFDKANVAKNFVSIDGGNHNNLQDKHGKEYWHPIIQFIKSH